MKPSKKERKSWLKTTNNAVVFKFMNVQIITPDKELFAGEASLAQFPGLDGSFEILNNHAPMVAALRAGKVKLRLDDDKEEFIEIRGGLVEVLDNQLLVLAE